MCRIVPCATLLAVRHVLVVSCAILTACAPDAVNNRAATGFNGFVNTISRACAPLQLGRYQLSDPLMGGAGGNSYDYWLDQTSRLYYRRIDQALMRAATNIDLASEEAGRVATATARTKMVERAYREVSRQDERARSDRERLELIARGSPKPDGR